MSAELHPLTQKRIVKIRTDAVKEVDDAVDRLARRASAEGWLASGNFLQQIINVTAEVLKRHFSDADLVFRQLTWRVGEYSNQILRSLLVNVRDDVLHNFDNGVASRTFGSAPLIAARRGLVEAIEAEIDSAVLDFEQGIVRRKESPVTTITHNTVSFTNSPITHSVISITQSSSSSPAAKEIAQGIQRLLEMPEFSRLTVQDQDDIKGAAQDALAELEKPAPDGGRIARFLRAIRSISKDVMTGVASQLLADLIKRAIDMMSGPSGG